MVATGSRMESQGCSSLLPCLPGVDMLLVHVAQSSGTTLFTHFVIGNRQSAIGNRPCEVVIIWYHVMSNRQSEIRSEVANGSSPR